MNDWNDEPYRPGMENIVRRLRRDIRLGDTFEVRVMAAVHAEALARLDSQHAGRGLVERGSITWWRRRYSIRFTPLGGLAMAASVFGMIFLGGRVMSGSLSSTAGSSVLPPPAIATPASTHEVHFILVDRSAQKVSLVGDFNGWSRTATPLTRSANGAAWTTSIPLGDGRYEYAFIVSDTAGERWVADPFASTVKDEFGTESSIVRVERADAAASSS
ncbi:MAG TPA: isoamylase early set domain-containing protein [Gemmatimonadaceae bacterium]|nr:isoamylase early set domain-containing protein [Gemmatimonadaceae bacterium]